MSPGISLRIRLSLSLTPTLNLTLIRRPAARHLGDCLLLRRCSAHPEERHTVRVLPATRREPRRGSGFVPSRDTRQHERRQRRMPGHRLRSAGRIGPYHDDHDEGQLWCAARLRVGTGGVRRRRQGRGEPAGGRYGNTQLDAVRHPRGGSYRRLRECDRRCALPDSSNYHNRHSRSSSRSSRLAPTDCLRPW